MKKTYIQPSIEEVKIVHAIMLPASLSGDSKTPTLDPDGLGSDDEGDLG